MPPIIQYNKPKRPPAPPPAHSMLCPLPALLRKGGQGVRLGEQRGVKVYCVLKTSDGDTNVQAFHEATLLHTETLVRLRRTGLHVGTGAHFSGAPPQQFSVRKASNAFMVSNCAA